MNESMTPKICIAIAISLFVIASVCLFVGTYYKPRQEQAMPSNVLKSTYVDFNYMKTIKHDGHRFVVWGNDGIIHHPDCVFDDMER